MPISDNEIIERIRGGATHLFAQLVDRYKRQAMTLAKRMLNNRQDAEEAAQDAFMRAFKGLSRFEGKAKFSTWLYRIVYNVCLTKLGQRKQEHHPVEYDDEQYSQSDMPIGGASLESEIESKDLIRIVKTIIETLPVKYSVALTLYYLQECSYDEICAITELPLGTVKAHVFRARVILQRRLTEELRMENAIL